MSKTFSIRSLFVAMAVVALFLAIAVAVWPESRFIYRRYFGDYRFGIEIGGEIDVGGQRHRTLNTSYYDPPALMYGAGTFRIPDLREPEFETVVDDENSLFCIYDRNGWGYIAIVNTRTNELFSSASRPYVKSDTIQWRDAFDLLKSKHPDLPCAEVFDNAKKSMLNAGQPPRDP